MTRTATPARTRRRVGAVATAGLLAVLLVGCGGSDGDDASASDPAPASQSDEPDAPDSSSDAPAATDLPAWAPKVITDDNDDVTGLDFSDIEPTDQLEVYEITTGDGPAVKQGETITADYFGQLADQDTPFDESYSTEPFNAPIGVGSLIAGWDQGLVGVPVGSRVVMQIPSDLGYGDAGQGPIPGGATLYFVIDIIDATT